MKNFFIGQFILLSVIGLNAKAQSTSSLKDSLVADFNHQAFDRYYNRGATVWQSKAKQDDISGWLGYIYSLTGQVVSCNAYKQDKGYSYYKWEGTKKTMCFMLKPGAPGIFDDFNFTVLTEPVSLAQGSAIATDNPLKTPVDSAVHLITASFMIYNKLVGVSLGIIKNGKTFTYNYGTKEKGLAVLPSSRDTYEIASITKTFTGILLAHAVLDKKINLQDDIRRYISGSFPNLSYKGKPIRVVHLANHRSGLLHELPNLAAYTSPFDVLKMYDGYTDEKFLEDLHKVTIDTLPGTTYQYSNAGVKLLGLILERVYKTPYAELIKKFITVPYDMTHTIPSLAVSDTTSYMKGYDENGAVMPHNNFNMFGGSGGLLSTVDDMLHYLKYNLAGKDPAAILSLQPTWADSTHGMGLCWEIDFQNPHGTAYWKDGGALGFRSYAIVVPSKKTGIVWIANKSGLGEELHVMIKQLLDEVIENKLP